MKHFSWDPFSFFFKLQGICMFGKINEWETTTRGTISLGVVHQGGPLRARQEIFAFYTKSGSNPQLTGVKTRNYAWLIAKFESEFWTFVQKKKRLALTLRTENTNLQRQRWKCPREHLFYALKLRLWEFPLSFIISGKVKTERPYAPFA